MSSAQDVGKDEFFKGGLRGIFSGSKNAFQIPLGLPFQRGKVLGRAFYKGNTIVESLWHAIEIMLIENLFDRLHRKAELEALLEQAAENLRFPRKGIVHYSLAYPVASHGECARCRIQILLAFCIAIVIQYKKVRGYRLWQKRP